MEQLTMSTSDSDTTRATAASDSAAASDSDTSATAISVPSSVTIGAADGEPCGVYVISYDDANYYNNGGCDDDDDMSDDDSDDHDDDDDERRAVNVGTLYTFGTHQRVANMQAFMAACHSYGITTRVVWHADDAAGMTRTCAVYDAGDAIYDVTHGFVGATAGQLAAMFGAMAAPADSLVHVETHGEPSRCIARHMPHVVSCDDGREYTLRTCDEARAFISGVATIDADADAWLVQAGGHADNTLPIADAMTALIDAYGVTS